MSASPAINIPDERFVQLSGWLASLQCVFASAGYPEVYIGGGSARDVLDHLYHRAPLSMRDLDLYLLQGRPVVPADVQHIAARVVCQRLAGGDPDRIRHKTRANPALPLPARNAYVTGYGVHLDAPGLPILSLGVLHSRDDLALNGLFDIDTINLCLPLGARLGLEPVEIIDPHGGYTAWRERRPQIVHWAEVQRCYVRHSLRIARGFARAGLDRLEPAFLQRHRACRPRRLVVDSLRELHRDLLKLLAGTRWRAALRMLGELDVLGTLFPAIQARLQDPTPFPEPQGPHALQRARALLAPLSELVLAELEAVAPSVFGD